MFIYTFKANKKALIGAGMVGLALLILFFVIPSGPKPVKSSANLSNKAETNAERIAFIAKFGYDVINEPVETKSVFIPLRFDDTYLSYNQLQAEQGFDLTKYKGKNVKSYSYAITNYPNMENSQAVMRANLLVSENRIIGADVCSVQSDGFMHALVNGTT